MSRHTISNSATPVCHQKVRYIISMELSSLPSLPYFDLHCDTAYELYRQHKSLNHNDLAISLDGAAGYSHYAQFFAVWSDKRLSDEETYEQFFAIADAFSAQYCQPEVAAHMAQVRTAQELDTARAENKSAAILAVEDARLLAGDLSRLRTLAGRGVRYLTLLWSGESCIGGAHDTNRGLTEFGKEVVRTCFTYGILPDISHASAQSADDTLDLACRIGCPVLATHSDAYTVYPHSRNLRDEHFRAVMQTGGLVGINLYRAHLCNPSDHPAGIRDILCHIEHYLALGGENHLAIGGDLDGADLPEGFHSVADVSSLALAMRQEGYPESVIRKIFYENADRFFHRCFS